MMYDVMFYHCGKFHGKLYNMFDDSGQNASPTPNLPLVLEEMAIFLANLKKKMGLSTVITTKSCSWDIWGYFLPLWEFL